jgi:pimeloyl-ACP methyl ester carboxylesterase
MGGANRQAWGEIPEQLRSAGYAVLSFDFRGHGDSDGQLEPPNAAIDLYSALAHLRAQPQVDAERIALVGASMGGSASVIVGANDPRVRTVVAISTSPSAAGQYPGAVIGQLNPRPFLALGCDEDPITKPDRVRQLYEAAGPPRRVVILKCAAHANDILKTKAAAELQDLLLRWIDSHITTAP